MQNEMETVTGLWLRDSKSGRQYYGGKDRDGNQWMVFLNDKRKQADPDLSLCRVRANQPIAESDNGGAVVNAAAALFGKQTPIAYDNSEHSAAAGNDDVPF